MISMTKQLTTEEQNKFDKKTRVNNPIPYIQIIVIILFAAIPFIFPSFRLMDVMAKIMIFTIVVASFDLLLGYTGILSFAHGMFFGIGAYCLALILYYSSAPAWYHIVLATIVSLVISIAIALIISFFSLRVKAIFFAMLCDRETWCRYFCPPGNFAGLFSLSATLFVRSNPNVCSTKCNTHNCHKGALW